MGYYNNVRNKIASGVPQYQGSDLILPYVNLSRYSVYGAELFACAKWGIVGMTLGYAYINENVNENVNGNGNGNVNNSVDQYLPPRPHSLTWQCTLDKKISSDYALSATLSGRFLSAVSAEEYADYYDITKGTVDVHYPAYSLWKLSLVQTFCQKVKLSLALDNIFNYKPRYYYMNAPVTDGTNFMVGVGVEL